MYRYLLIQLLNRPSFGSEVENFVSFSFAAYFNFIDDMLLYMV